MPRNESLLEAQKAAFSSGDTADISMRKQRLESLAKEIRHLERDIFDALWQDLRKSAHESYVSEVGMVLDEIRFTVKNLSKWSKPRRLRTPLALQPGKSLVRREPYGSCLILSPWNYPFQLAMLPLVAAIGAGNCVVVKPSELAPATSAVISQIIDKVFSMEIAASVEGDVHTAQKLLSMPFDMVFFTGSTSVGKKVMEAAAKHLTPVILELGGKSPCIVDGTTDLAKTAKRIAWGKLMNAGQTCVAPDYLLVQRETVEPLLERLKGSIDNFYGRDPQSSPDYARIVSRRHFDRLIHLMKDHPKAFGGTTDPEDLYIAPTGLLDPPWDSPVMEEEIFGPILPVLPYDNLDDAIRCVEKRPKPLACYVFSSDKKTVARVTHEIPFGGGCVNDVVLHLGNPHLPFGGIGNSGMGAYHGHEGFLAFTHPKSVLKKSFFMDLELRYPPYKGKLAKLRKLIG